MSDKTPAKTKPDYITRAEAEAMCNEKIAAAIAAIRVELARPKVDYDTGGVGRPFD